MNATSFSLSLVFLVPVAALRADNIHTVGSIEFSLYLSAVNERLELEDSDSAYLFSTEPGNVALTAIATD